MLKKSLGLLLAALLLVSVFAGCDLPAAVPELPDATEISSIAGNSGAAEAVGIPAYSGKPYVPVNGNVPYFTPEEILDVSFETYSDLDYLGRCGVATASVGLDLMPTEERQSIGMVKPSGWHSVKYDFVDGKYLYNRCHLIGFQLSGENANERNLVTGTRALNIQGMLPFENMVADYVHETGNHVMYRVTPDFRGKDLVCTGVLMEGWSVEDDGEGICFCVYAYNAQPGVVIDYATGDNREGALPEEEASAGESTYIINTNSGVFHNPDCSGAAAIKEKNRETFTGSRETLIDQGYKPCGRCNP